MSLGLERIKDLDEKLDVDALQRNLDRIDGTFPLTAGAGTLQKVPQSIVTSSVVQSIPDATWTALTFDTTESEVQGPIWDGTDFTVVRPGLYLVGGDVVLGHTGASLYASGWVGSRRYSAAQAETGGGGDYPHVSASTVVRLAAGDSTQIRVYQASGGARNTYIDANFVTRAYAIYLSP